MGTRKNWNPGAILIADAIARLPEDSKECVREAQKIGTKRQRKWLSEMRKELAAAREEKRRPVGTPCPPPALALNESSRIPRLRPRVALDIGAIDETVESGLLLEDL